MIVVVSAFMILLGYFRETSKVKPDPEAPHTAENRTTSLTGLKTEKNEIDAQNKNGNVIDEFLDKMKLRLSRKNQRRLALLSHSNVQGSSNYLI